MQLIAPPLGGEVARADTRESGPALLPAEEAAGLCEGMPAELPVWMSHGDHVLRLPSGFHGLASSTNAPVAAFSDGGGVLGIQFHPEVHHTPQGRDILRNFLYRVCGCTGTWTAGSFIAGATRAIEAAIGDGRVIFALRGGLHSAAGAPLAPPAGRRPPTRPLA